MPTLQESHFHSAMLVELFANRIIKSRAVGLDGTRLEKFENIIASETALIERKVLSGTYSFTSYREKLISKGAYQLPRQISIPTVRDRLTLRAICNCLAEIAPSARTLPPHNYIKEIAGIIKGSNQPLSFLRVDVRDFFPSLKHDVLHSALQDAGCEKFLIDLIFKAIENGTGFAHDRSQRNVGVPQGLSISNLLSSIYMTEFDRKNRDMGDYRRYVDDILVIAPSHKINERYHKIFSDLSEIGLRSHPMNKSGKTEIKRIGEGIDYLGYNLKPTLISVRTSSYNRMFQNINKVITLFKYKKNYRQFLFKLNIRITGCVVDGKRKGWLMFFSQTESVQQLRYLDIFVESQFKKVGIEYKSDEVSRFVKAYHEIRYKGINSSYIPNFDSYTLAQQYELISTLTGASLEEINSRSIEDTDHEFKTLVAREVADLEQDVLNAAS